MDTGELALKLICGIILAFVGDYILQNNYVANWKTKDSLIALEHVITYHVPFIGLFLWDGKFSLLECAMLIVMGVTHFFIDRYRLAELIVAWKNGRGLDRTNSGFPPETPAFIAVWVMIIVDNTLHIAINSICITFAHAF